ncbi:hypothetical protein [Accumulibacter sp.]|uniref:hypothetical protein n=1 Tax=Accumulibacter sp. TaxID=2053492 RepID=UPI0025D738D0|nr:hypothetical protein [Accumulibacter sp.]MCM8595365.1 hypothetical protein [Accumulibacter sp.]MCM8625292.1 hypothetical protein [Accumulibacter sp.]MDS4049512.1 hypothetical protein [Accumulibacter sp.]
MAAIDAVRSVCAGRLQVFFSAVWPSARPQCVSSHLHIWEFNIRDSTILGIAGAGGLGMLISEASALFQSERLSTILTVVVLRVASFDAISRRIRKALPCTPPSPSMPLPRPGATAAVASEAAPAAGVPPGS